MTIHLTIHEFEIERIPEATGERFMRVATRCSVLDEGAGIGMMDAELSEVFRYMAEVYPGVDFTMHYDPDLRVHRFDPVEDSPRYVVDPECPLFFKEAE